MQFTIVAYFKFCLNIVNSGALSNVVKINAILLFL